MLTLIVLNLYIFIRLKRSKATVGLNVFSVFLLAFLFCTFLEVSAIDLEIEQYFRIAGMIFLLVSVFFALYLAVVFYKNRVKLRKLKIFPPDLTVLLKEIDDHIIIFDHQGKLYYQNHPHQLNDILGLANIRLSDVNEILLQMVPEGLHKEINLALRDKKTLDCEVFFSNTDQYFLLKTAPVLTKRKKLIAFIILLHDISSENKLAREVENKNSNLEDVNRQLISYVEVAHVLESERERLKLLEKIQGELIDKINMVIKEINKIYHKEYPDTIEFKKDITLITEKLRNLYQMIRNTIRNIYERRG